MNTAPSAGSAAALWTLDPTAYYGYLQAAGYGSSTGRYNKLIDDIRNDIGAHRSILRSARNASSISTGGAR